MNLDQIDRFLEKLRTAEDDDQLRRFFQEYSANYDVEVPADPFSREYREKQFALYRLLARKDYSVDNEKTEFDIDAAAVSPFPFCHGSAETVGNQLMAIGFLIRKMNLPKGARILEFGPGWGNTTLALAKMGYQVTAVDIEKNFVELIGKRAAMEGLKIDVVLGDFSYIETTNDLFDAVLFFECFHHAQDHLALMRGFDRVVRPHGLVCFGSEPILDDFPIPWGLRMDGESLWAIRNHGWLELGFNKKYFQAALDHFGWAGFEYAGADSPWSKALIARRKTTVQKTYTFDEGLRTQVGRLIDGTLETSGNDEGYVVYGPYAELPPGNWKAEVVFDDAFRHVGTLVMDVAEKAGSSIVAPQQRFDLDGSAPGTCRLDFANCEPLSAFEVRVKSLIGTKVRIKGVRLSYRTV